MLKKIVCVRGDGTLDLSGVGVAFLVAGVLLAAGHAKHPV